MRIEATQPVHRDIMQKRGSLRINNVPFTNIEGRLISDVVSDDVGMKFDGVRGYNLLRDDLSVIRPAYQGTDSAASEPAGEEDVPLRETDSGLLVPEGATGETPTGGEGGGGDDEGDEPPPDTARADEMRMHVLATLRTAAAQAGITGASRMSKDALVDALLQAERDLDESIDLDAIAEA